MCWFSGYKACGTLVPQPGIEPAALEVEVWLLNLRIPRELPRLWGKTEPRGKPRRSSQKFKKKSRQWGCVN